MAARSARKHLEAELFGESPPGFGVDLEASDLLAELFGKFSGGSFAGSVILVGHGSVPLALVGRPYGGVGEAA